MGVTTGTTSLLAEQTKRKKNAHLDCSQKQRTTPQSSQSSGSTSAELSPGGDLRQDLVPWRRHPRALHDRPEDGEEGMTAWQSRRWRERENSSFGVLSYILQCDQMQTM